MFWSSLLSVSCAGLAYVLTANANKQYPLGTQNIHAEGLLKRYALSQLPGTRLEDILAQVGDSNAHVWDIGPSHIDVVYRQPHAQQLDLPIPDLGSVPLSHIEDLHRHTGKRDIGSLSNSTYHAVYHPLYEVEDFLQSMADAHPHMVALTNLGHTAEGREMLALRISKSDDELRSRGRDSISKKVGFVITGAQHAREWIATSTALYLAHALVAETDEDHALSSWLDYFDFYIIPVPNPDGYVYTWETDRLWYKNRQIVGPAEKCVGVDMNRLGHKWKSKSRLPSFSGDTNEAISDVSDPCSPWYPGHRPFESPEVNNIANFITTLPALKAYVDLRSYGQMLSTPFSYSCKKVPKDAEDQLEAALGAANAIKQVHGTHFTTGSLCDQLYKASGNVVDYMYAKAQIKFAYSVHLRDTGTYGFSLPAEWIRPVGEETANMIRFLAGFISGRNKKGAFHLYSLLRSPDHPTVADGKPLSSV
ncbi:hypothetical protein C8Q77DRAFT_1053878 [Trametes polyzona]|nr:hypothetical protein C8Q77DRAFT_1053878 [Trametes polyzona]